MKIIQIAATSRADNFFGDGVYVLCDDGSIYLLNVRGSGRTNDMVWIKLPDLPEDK